MSSNLGKCGRTCAVLVLDVVQHPTDVSDLARIQPVGTHCTCRLERASPGSIGGIFLSVL